MRTRKSTAAVLKVAIVISLCGVALERGTGYPTAEWYAFFEVYSTNKASLLIFTLKVEPLCEYTGENKSFVMIGQADKSSKYLKEALIQASILFPDLLTVSRDQLLYQQHAS